MACTHLKQLFQLCEENELKLSGSDLIRVVCGQCGEQEVCPSTLTEEYDARVSLQKAKEQTDSQNANTHSTAPEKP